MAAWKPPPAVVSSMSIDSAVVKRSSASSQLHTEEGDGSALRRRSVSWSSFDANNTLPWKAPAKPSDSSLSGHRSTKCRMAHSADFTPLRHLSSNSDPRIVMSPSQHPRCDSPNEMRSKSTSRGLRRRNAASSSIHRRKEDKRACVVQSTDSCGRLWKNGDPLPMPARDNTHNTITIAPSLPALEWAPATSRQAKQRVSMWDDERWDISKAKKPDEDDVEWNCMAILPLEIQDLVLQQLDARTLCICERVCKAWHTMVAHSKVWRFRYLRDMQGSRRDGSHDEEGERIWKELNRILFKGDEETRARFDKALYNQYTDLPRGCNWWKNLYRERVVKPPFLLVYGRGLASSDHDSPRSRKAVLTYQQVMFGHHRYVCRVKERDQDDGRAVDCTDDVIEGSPKGRRRSRESWRVDVQRDCESSIVAASGDVVMSQERQLARRSSGCLLGQHVIDPSTDRLEPNVLLDHRHLRLSDGVTEYYQGRKWVDPLNCYFPEAIRRVVVVSSTCKMPDWEIRVKVEGVVRLDASLAEEWFAHLQGRKLHSLVGEQQRLSWARSHSKPRRGTVHELSHHRTPEMVRRNTSSSSPSRRQSIR